MYACKRRFYAVARRQTDKYPKNIYLGLKEIRESFAKRADGSLIEKPVQASTLFHAKTHTSLVAFIV